MTMQTYTIHDDPAVRRRVEGDIDLVTRTVREGDSSLRSLVLTGGFARGEGAVLDGEPQNDYDFVAFRGLGRPERSYHEMARELEEEIGIHIDLAPVAAWRIHWLSPSIFWYETALRGRVLWGEDLLDRIPTRDPAELEPSEGMRLLVNRAAGLLLVRGKEDPHGHRIQASKGLLGVADVHLLASGEFPPSQTERWNRLADLRLEGQAPRGLDAFWPWLEWAYDFKVDPANAAPREAQDAWQVATQAVLDSVPTALRHAGFSSLDDYGRTDGVIDHLIYYKRAYQAPHVRGWLTNPTGRVRVATIRLLEACADGTIRPQAAERILGPLAAESAEEPLRILEELRGATLQ